MKLCVSCKACRHECPTGVDMARMKIEVLAARRAKHGLTLRDRLVGFLPHYAPLFSRLAPLANMRNNSKLLRALLERVAGISAKRALPEWRRDVFAPEDEVFGPPDGHEVVLFADTFNRNYERENLDAALRVLVAGGYRVHIPKPADQRPSAVLRPHLPLGRARRSRPHRARSIGCDLCAVRGARRADRWPRAKLSPDLARRTSVAAFGRDGESHQRARPDVRGIPGPRGWRGASFAGPQADRGKGRRARPLSPEILWRVQAGRAGACA